MDDIRRPSLAESEDALALLEQRTPDDFEEKGSHDEYFPEDAANSRPDGDGSAILGDGNGNIDDCGGRQSTSSKNEDPEPDNSDKEASQESPYSIDEADGAGEAARAQSTENIPVELGSNHADEVEANEVRESEVIENEECASKSEDPSLREDGEGAIQSGGSEEEEVEGCLDGTTTKMEEHDRPPRLSLVHGIVDDILISVYEKVCGSESEVDENEYDPGSHEVLPGDGLVINRRGKLVRRYTLEPLYTKTEGGDDHYTALNKKLEELRRTSTVAAADAVRLEEVRVAKRRSQWKSEFMRRDKSKMMGSGQQTWTWGDGKDGQLCQPDEWNQFRPAMIKVSEDTSALRPHAYVQLAFGEKHAMGLREVGDIYVWGTGNDNQLGIGEGVTEAFIARKVAGLNHVVVRSIACSPMHCAAITANGELFTWGEGLHGKLGHGDEEDVCTPRRVQSIKNRVVKIVCGRYHSIALCETGSTRQMDYMALVAGSNTFGQLGMGAHIIKLVEFTNNEFLTKQQVLDVSTGTVHTLAITADRDVLAFGDNAHGQLGVGDYRERFYPEVIDTFPREGKVSIVMASCGLTHSVFLSSDGKVFTAGRGESGQLGHGDTKNRVIPTMVKAFTTYKKVVKKVACGVHHSVMLTEDNMIYSCGAGAQGALGHQLPRKSDQSNIPFFVEAFIGFEITDVACGEDFCGAVTTSHLPDWQMNVPAELQKNKDARAMIEQMNEDRLERERQERVALIRAWQRDMAQQMEDMDAEYIRDQEIKRKKEQHERKKLADMAYARRRSNLLLLPPVSSTIREHSVDFTKPEKEYLKARQKDEKLKWMKPEIGPSIERSPSVEKLMVEVKKEKSVLLSEERDARRRGRNQYEVALNDMTESCDQYDRQWLLFRKRPYESPRIHRVKPLKSNIHQRSLSPKRQHNITKAYHLSGRDLAREIESHYERGSQSRKSNYSTRSKKCQRKGISPSGSLTARPPATRKVYTHAYSPRSARINHVRKSQPFFKEYAPRMPQLNVDMQPSKGKPEGDPSGFVSPLKSEDEEEEEVYTPPEVSESVPEEDGAQQKTSSGTPVEEDIPSEMPESNGDTRFADDDWRSREADPLY